MKPIFQTNHRNGSVALAARVSCASAKTNRHAAKILNDICGRCAADCKLPFGALGRDYFTREAQHHFASEAVVFCLLAITTFVPLLNGATAVIELIRSKQPITRVVMSRA